MEKKHVYMDHNATTPLHPRVIAAMSEAMEVYGNPSSFHEDGRIARELVESARGEAASLINAAEDEIVFTGSGSEANNTVLNLFPCPSACSKAQRGWRSKVITTKIEHPCILETARCLSIRGTDVAFVGVDENGLVDIDELENTINDQTALVSVMTANNEIGTIQDIRTIADLVHDRGAYFHTDAVQAVGKIPMDVAALGIDFLSFSAHKMYGPKGVGALYVAKGVPYCPYIHGGHQEQGRRAGTENTLGIVGMGTAIACRKDEMADEDVRLRKLRERLKSGIADNIPDVFFNGHQEKTLAGTLNATFTGCEGEALLLYLDMEGISVSTGSACSSGSLDPSHVLLATGLAAESAHGSIRFSLGRDNTAEDVDYVVDRLITVVNKVRSMSSVYTAGT